MANILLWIGIIIGVCGWLALAWQASKRITMKDESEKFPERRRIMALRRNYCWLTILVGIVLVIIALLI